MSDVQNDSDEEDELEGDQGQGQAPPSMTASQEASIAQKNAAEGLKEASQNNNIPVGIPNQSSGGGAK